MMAPEHNESSDFSIGKFERMLQTNDILFFDSNEFESIIIHYLEMGKMALAQKAVKIALSQHPDATILKLLKVEILLFKNKLNQADKLLNDLHEIEPSNPEIYIHKANILSKRSKHKEAITLLKSAKEISEDQDEINSLIAIEYMFMEDYESSKQYFIKCLEVDEEDTTALHNIIYCFDFLEQTEEAIDFLNIYLDKYPYSEIAWHQVGLQYVKTKDYERALASFDFAIISDDRFVGAYMEKGKVLQKTKRYGEAIECYQTTLNLEDPTAFAYLRIAKCYEKIYNADLALKYYNKALQEDPLLDKTWKAVTDFYYRRKRYKQALYYVKKALSIDEKNISYWHRYAKINEQLKHAEEAEKGFRKSMEYGDFEFETWIKRCDILIELKQFETALNIMEQAHQFYPEEAEIEYRLAGLYFSINNDTLGYVHLKKGLALEVDYALIIEDLFPEIFTNKEINNLLGQRGYFD